MRNRQIPNDTGISLKALNINMWINTQFKNFHAKFKESRTDLVITLCQPWKQNPQ